MGSKLRKGDRVRVHKFTGMGKRIAGLHGVITSISKTGWPFPYCVRLDLLPEADSPMPFDDWELEKVEGST